MELWDVTTGQRRATIDGHSQDVFSVAFSPDGQTLASLSWDETVRLWNVGPPQVYAILRGHKAPVKSLSFSRDGRLLRSTDEQKTTNYWNLSDGCQVLKSPREEFLPDSPISPNGKLQAEIRGNSIWLVDRSIHDEKNSKHDIGLARQQATVWHEQQCKQARKDNQWFAVAFHQKKLVDRTPWNANARADEAKAWLKAGHTNRAAFAFVQMVLCSQNPWIRLYDHQFRTEKRLPFRNSSGNKQIQIFNRIKRTKHR